MYVCFIRVCFVRAWQTRGVAGGTRQDEEDGEVEEVTESVSGSVTAGL